MTVGEVLLEAIEKRHSWRSYVNRPLAADVRQRLADVTSHVPPTPFGTRPALKLVESAGQDNRHLGTYGVITGANTFLTGTVRPGPGALEDFAFAMEHAVLVATRLGLGTCWLGGTFKRRDFQLTVQPTGDEVIPAVVAVGYSADRPNLAQRFFHWTARSDQRLPNSELFFDGRFGVPLSEAAAGTHATALSAVRMAPSGRNAQPWRVVRTVDLSGVCFHFYVQTRDMVDHVVPEIPRLDLGIAMAHMEIGCKAKGIAGRWVAHSLPPAPPEKTVYLRTWVTPAATQTA